MIELRAEFTALKTTAGDADPVRLRYIESLLGKAERAGGTLATLLEARVRDALGQYRQQLGEAGAENAGKPPRGTTGLRDLVRQLDEHRAVDDDPDLAPLEQTLRQQELDLVEALDGRDQDSLGRLQPSQEELRSARRFHSAMVRQNADRVVNQALAEIPDDCGPLNPQRLATRSLATMRDLSPHYLSRFVSYIDTLFWLENADRGK